MPSICTRTRDDSPKRCIKRITDCDNKPHESGAAARCQQSQEESHSEQRIDYVENIINNLRDPRETSRSHHFTLTVNDLVDGFRTKLAGNLIDSLRFTSGFFGGSAFTDFGLHFAFNLTLN